MPDMHGSGRARDLAEAVSQSPALAAKLTAFSQGTTRDAQMALLDELITAWAQSSDYWSTIEENLQGEKPVVVALNLPGSSSGVTISFGGGSGSLLGRHRHRRPAAACRPQWHHGA